MSEPTLKLPRNADELLREYPFKEPDFEAQAKAIEARLKGSPGGVMFDDYLKTPGLAAEPGEPAAPSSTRAASAPKSNFAEMARKSVQQKDDSADIAKELMAATAQSRRPNAEMVERVRAAGRVAATGTPLPTGEDAQRTSGVVARAETAAPPAAAVTAAPMNRGTLIGIAGGLFALAAGVALFVKSGQSDNQTLAALAAEKAADVPVLVAPKGGAAGPAAAKPNAGVVSPEALAAAPMPAAEEAKAGSPKVAAAPGAGVAAAPPAKSVPPASAGAKQEAIVLEDDAAPPQVAAPPKPEPTPEPQLKPAEGSSSGVPLSPSAGALSTALGSVRSDAQACLAGQSDPVTAIVTFSADGHVLRVNAPGPSGSCIQAALSKAHLAPFAKESFTASTTIRPP